MIAITNEEKYLAKIAGEEITTPEPVLRKEQYLSAIANGEGTIPELPVTREEWYLAILAGENYAIPSPETRLERYMAKACGLDIDTPLPITNVEYYWAIIAEGGSWPITTLTGSLPLSFLSKGEALTNYLLHGTSEGAGVETENLFDKSAYAAGYVSGKILDDNGDETNSSRNGYSTYFISVMPGNPYTICGDLSDGSYASRIYYYDENNNFLLRSATFIVRTLTDTYKFTPPNNCKKIRIQSSVAATRNIVMLVSDSTAPTTYIPYGYKIPLTNTGENIADTNSSNVKTGYLDETQRVCVFTSASVVRTLAVKCSPNTKYKISKMLSSRFKVAYTHEPPDNNVPIYGYISADAETSIVVNTDSLSEYLVVQFYNSNYDTETMQTVLNSIRVEQISTYPLYIGSTKLGEEEYLDYESGKVYKRTENLFSGKGPLQNLGGYSSLRYLDSCIQVSPGETVCLNASSALYSRLSFYLGYNRKSTSYWITTQSSVTIPDGCDNASVEVRNYGYNRITDEQLATATEIMLIRGSTPPDHYIPYLQPTDPPVPFPAISTYKGENTLSSTETVGECSVTGRIKETET